MQKDSERFVYFSAIHWQEEVMHQDFHLFVGLFVCKAAPWPLWRAFWILSVLAFCDLHQNVRDFSDLWLFCCGWLCGVCSHAGGVDCCRGVFCLGRQGQRKLQGLSNRGPKTDGTACLHVPDCQLHVIHNAAVQPPWGKVMQCFIFKFTSNLISFSWSDCSFPCWLRFLFAHSFLLREKIHWNRKLLLKQRQINFF